MPAGYTTTTCALYGVANNSNYTTGWLGVNLLIIVAALLIIACVYSLSGLFGESIRERIRGIARYELIQAIVCGIIIAMILTFTVAACNISASVSQNLAGTAMNPFQWADYYIGSVALNNGLTILTNLYSQSVSLQIIAQVLNYEYANILTQFVNRGFGLFEKILGITQVGFITLAPQNQSLGLVFNILSSAYLIAYSPIILIAVGLLIIQFLMLPLFQATAFIVVLPIALAMRSLSFASRTLMDSSNALIAIAIAMYLIYPMMIAFDSYLMAYTFSASNPLYTYIQSVTASQTVLNSIGPNTFFQDFTPTLGTSGGFFATAESTIFPFLYRSVKSQGVAAFNEAFQGGFLEVPALQLNVNVMARFVFQAILLFAINLAVTIGFAMSLAKALGSTLGEVGGFWGG